MKRRQFLLMAALGVLVPRPLCAQSHPRVAILVGVPREKSVATRMLLERLAELGYREGATMRVDYRYVAGPDGYAAAARDLAGRKYDLIFTIGNEGLARALRDTPTSTPVILIATDYDPVESGIVQSLARPGGSLTGVYIPISALLGKRIEIAQEIFPTASRYLVLADRFSRSQLESIRRLADARGLKLTVAEFTHTPYDLAAAFEVGRREQVKGVFVLLSAEFFARRHELSALLERHGLPAFAPDIMANDPGVLASYSINSRKFIRRAADLGERILKGTKPGDIPMEQPDEYTVVINLKTARALGIKVPYSVLSRATKVIE